MSLVPTIAKSLCYLLLVIAACGQGRQDFLSGAFASEQAGPGLLLGPDMPRLTLTLGNRPAEVKAHRNGIATLVAPDSEVALEARLSREGPFEYCRIRPASDSPLASEELKLLWSFSMAYNESMTLDADGWKAIPCTCRMERFHPPAA